MSREYHGGPKAATPRNHQPPSGTAARRFEQIRENRYNERMTATKLALLLAGLVFADMRLASALTADQPAVQAYGNVNRSCREWTDGCVVCVKNSEDSPSCSTPGIACQPKDVICKGPAAPATPR